jgi:hypothetical protein
MADSAYPLFRTLHVLGAVLLLGNVTVTGVWSIYLYRAWRAGTIPFRPLARAILWTDLIFTVSGGALLTFTGIQLALKLRLPFPETRWLAEGVGALALATLLWLVVLLPDQIRMERTTDPARLRKLFLRWSVVGWFSTAILFFGLWAMVSKR